MNETEKCPECGWSVQDVNELTEKVEKLTREREQLHRALHIARRVACYEGCPWRTK